MLILGLAVTSVFGQWIQVYETDSCNCPLGIHTPINGMAFFGADSGVVIAGESTVNAEVVFTTNSGKSWSKNSIDNSVINSQGIRPAFSDINHIWLYQWPIIYHSSDAGKNWQTDTLHDTLSSNITCFYFQDSLLGFAGGEGLMIFRTSDGGKSWNRVNDPEKDVHNGNYEIHYITFIDAKFGLAAGGDFHTYILRTIDGGLSWKREVDSINSEVPNTAVGLSYPDPVHAFLCTTFGHFYSSSDSGKTWNQAGKPDPLGAGFRSITFIDSLHGVAAGGSNAPRSYSLILGYTSDAGRSWRTASIDSESYESTASYPEKSIAYVGGYDAIFKLNIKDLVVVSPFTLRKRKVQVSLSPNPGNGLGKISYELVNASQTQIEVYDPIGRLVSDIVNVSEQPGLHEHEFNFSSLPSGQYFFRLRSGEISIVKGFVLER